MIKELREVGEVHDAPILIIHLDLAPKEWVGLAYKDNLDYLSGCFWSTRDDERVPTNELLDEIAHDVAAALRGGSAENVREALFDVQYKQPPGWDRWLRGVPMPIGSFFDDVLHPELKALLKTRR
jgi:hypothetical protein